jgi:putative transposase
VLDQWSRESLAIEVDFSLTGQRVSRVLEQLRITRGLTLVIQADNGQELQLQLIEPSKPIQNAHIESFNAGLREECLNEHFFVKLADGRSKIEKGRIQGAGTRESAQWACIFA